MQFTGDDFIDLTTDQEYFDPFHITFFVYDLSESNSYAQSHEARHRVDSMSRLICIQLPRVSRPAFESGGPAEIGLLPTTGMGWVAPVKRMGHPLDPLDPADTPLRPRTQGRCCVTRLGLGRAEGEARIG
jgi:hypothetical protein